MPSSIGRYDSCTRQEALCFLQTADRCKPLNLQFTKPVWAHRIRHRGNPQTVAQYPQVPQTDGAGTTDEDGGHEFSLGSEYQVQVTQGYPGQPTGMVAWHLTTLAALISGIVGGKSAQLPHIA